MVVLDAFKGYVTQELKGEIRKTNTALVTIPGGMTSQLQVLDVAVNKPFKARLRQPYNGWLVRCNHALTPSGKLKKTSMLWEWILTARERNSSESTVTGFKMWCTSNALDGTNNDFLWQDEENRE
jgi:hypothetical protein